MNYANTDEKSEMTDRSIITTTSTTDVSLPKIMNNTETATRGQSGQYNGPLSTEEGFKPLTSVLPSQDTTEANTPKEESGGHVENDEREKDDEFDGMTDDEIKNVVDSQIYNRPDTGFPAPMRKEAFRGVVGSVVGLTTKNSELCREAVLVQLLVAFGNMLGRGPWMWQEATHFCNEFAALVGKAISQAKRLLRQYGTG